MDNDTVTYLADLSRLDIPDQEKQSVAAELGGILGFVDEIQQVTIEDTKAGIGQVNVFRDDVVAPLHPAHDLVEAAAMHHDHFVKVPKVL